MPVADCGHEYTPPGPQGGASGYGTIDGRTHCYACCNRMERERFTATEPGERFMPAYLALRAGIGTAKPEYVLTTWPGGVLAHVTVTRVSRRRGFHGVPFERWYFRAVGFDGSKWYGNTTGPNMFTNVRRRAS